MIPQALLSGSLASTMAVSTEGWSEGWSSEECSTTKVVSSIGEGEVVGGLIGVDGASALAALAIRRISSSSLDCFARP